MMRTINKKGTSKQFKFDLVKILMISYKFIFILLSYINSTECKNVIVYNKVQINEEEEEEQTNKHAHKHLYIIL